MEMHPQSRKFFEKKYPEQRSEEWFAMRNTMLTASDAGTALGVNPYQKPTELILAKCGVKKPFSTWATAHGQKFEDEARILYEEKTGEKVFEIGLEQHPTELWIGGSPDGITHSGRLLEIKCPRSRAIGDGQPPVWYVAQVQVLMEVLDLEVCDFVQYRPESITYPNPPEFVVVEIKRDREWWSTNRPIMKAFWEKVIWHRANGHQELLPKPKVSMDDLMAKFEELKKHVSEFDKMLIEFNKEQSDLKTGRWSNEDEDWLWDNRERDMSELEKRLRRTPKAIGMRLDKLKKEKSGDDNTQWRIVSVKEDI